jgi:hypothetical protein
MNDPTPLTRRLYGKSKHKFERKPKPVEGIKHPVKLTGLSFVQPPEDVEEQNKLIQEMVDWAMTDESALDPEKFPILKRISPFKFKRIAETNEFFAEGFALANYIIGVRLKELTRERKLDKEYLFHFLQFYNPEFKAFMREKKGLESEMVREKIILLYKTPESPMVPNKREDEVD